MDKLTNSRRDFLKATGMGATALALPRFVLSSFPKKRPNILIFMADDWNWPHALHVYDPNIKTPTFDRIAREVAIESLDRKLVRFLNVFWVH